MKIINLEKRLIDKLVEECREEINGNEIVYNVTLNDRGRVCKSRTMYIVLLIIAILIIINISITFFFSLALKKR